MSNPILPPVETEKLPPKHYHLYIVGNVFIAGMFVLSIVGSAILGYIMSMPVGLLFGGVTVIMFIRIYLKFREKVQMKINKWEDSWRSPFDDDEWDESDVDQRLP